MPDEAEVAFTEYALMRMLQRDITAEEVLAALAAPSSRHTRRRDGRSEVRHRFGRRHLLVIYRRERTQIIVINAMWES